LEFYLTINQCEGLPSGLYHYEPLQHQLTRLRERDRFVESLLNYAIIAARQSNPQVLITLAARFQRISWKYDAIAYATTLKHVGVVYQTMYLVATAMNLAPCALGSGDSDMFAAAAKTDYFAETSVGEFILGSLPKPHQS
jgi:oxazoline/thiazoline dehydrogenase